MGKVHFRPCTAVLGLLVGGWLVVCSCSSPTRQSADATTSADSIHLLLTDSLARLDTLLIRYPKIADLYFQRAKVRFQLGDTLSALDDARRAVYLDERETEHWYLKAMIQLALQQEDSAMFALSTAANYGSSNPDVYLQLGNLHTVRQEYQQAEKWYQQAIQRGSRAADYFAHAFLMRQTGRFQEAEASLLAALDRDSTHHKSMVLLHDLYLDNLKDEDRALAVNLKMLRRDSLDPVARFQSGLHFFRQYDRLRGSAHTTEAQRALQRSILEYSIALKTNPSFVKARYQRGFAQLEAGNLVQAINDFETVLSQKSDYAEAEFMLASAYEKSNEKRLALEHYRRALALKPGWPEAQAAIRELEHLQRP
jgi:tetratricopeptide (TPR) repeat protein